ncbi:MULTISPECIES: hypothetical protein [Elizabethkingia]|uniref:Uncharacterized protein n=1 Tax=Elizabethkingia argenteiflava TaxID=2681556 RepID=A0A845PUY5_9FLAO|nr:MULTISPECIES: hypothetical protein [Elizabethkingia]NAW50913.1 hypothetical protein [Elizabethkingia argenteiflava]QGN22320.1 hypothetical protein GJV56_06620 [Elizabethkingia anophelis]UTF90730.1 hypothetical protein J2N93_06665 [Elizabethkingia anophelis]UTG01600.1 hypothetical protein J2O04_06665 [Elizabethkingia anophelis]UTG05350.1 hypothetical protein J2O03_06665 [Elizabethkingia anophelis]
MKKDWRVSSMIFAEYAIPKGSRKLLDPDVLKTAKEYTNMLYLLKLLLSKEQ